VTDTCLFPAQAFPRPGADRRHRDVADLGQDVERFGSEEQKQDLIGSVCDCAGSRSPCPSPRPGRTSAHLSCAARRVDGGYHFARKADEDPTTQLPREAAMVKLKVTETAKRVALEGMQMMGGYGYVTEYDMERHVRTTVASRVFAGTSEIQREIIGKSFGL